MRCNTNCATATAYAPHNLRPGGRTGHIRNVAPCAYNIHVHIHCDCAWAFHLHSHLGRDAPPSAKRIMRAARHLQRCNAPYRDAACAPQYIQLGEGCTCTYAHSFIFSFLLFPRCTVDSRNYSSAAVFRVRLGGHCREFGVNLCSNGAYFSIRRSQNTV